MVGEAAIRRLPDLIAVVLRPRNDAARAKPRRATLGIWPARLYMGGMRHRGASPHRGRPGMSTFDKREEGFEKKFAHDEQLLFKAQARRNKMLGLWAAEKLGKSGADADAYAKEVVIADLEEAGDDDVFRKVRKDFDAAGVDQSDHQIRRTMEELLAKAVAEVKAAG
jgi:hypothetical protein